VLITGESGVGKELVAARIHAASDRGAGPFVKVNCASVPSDLFESEFFGHVRGAFTSAHRNRTGRFELADGGTLFLDEVSEIPLELQVKLLRVLQEGAFERVGDCETRHTNVRVVAATNRDLEVEIAEGRFRLDLYYRLGVFPIFVPPLRERTQDIVPLAEHFIARHAERVGRPVPQLGAEEQSLLEGHDWPGNVRELENVIERALILARGSGLRLAQALHQAERSKGRAAEERPSPDKEPLMTDAQVRSFERENIERALEASGHRISGKGGAAERLGVPPSTLRDRVKALGIRRR
jgi:transcriptional regulator with GAF, ATPase, and Fis domain